MRYWVRLTVLRRGGWRAWGTVRSDFERAPAGLAAPAIAAAGIASEVRRGAGYVRVSVALSVAAADVAGALAIAWEAFRDAAAGDLAGWEVTAASAGLQPDLRLTGAGPPPLPAGPAGGLSCVPAAVGLCPGLFTERP